MKIFDIFKKKEPIIDTFEEWIDLPQVGSRNSNQEVFDFKKKYSINLGVEVKVNGKLAKISNIQDKEIITFDYVDGGFDTAYIEEFNKYRVEIFNKDLIDQNYISFEEFRDYVEEDNYEMVLKSFEYQYLYLEETMEVLERVAATHGRINAIQAALDAGTQNDNGLQRDKISQLFIVASEQGQLEIVKLLLANGADPVYRENLAIKVVGDNESVREFLLTHQEIIDRLVADGHDELLPSDIQEMFLF